MKKLYLLTHVSYKVLWNQRGKSDLQCVCWEREPERVRGRFTDLRSLKDERRIRESWGLSRQKSEKIKGLGLFKA